VYTAYAPNANTNYHTPGVCMAKRGILMKVIAEGLSDRCEFCGSRENLVAHVTSGFVDVLCAKCSKAMELAVEAVRLNYIVHITISELLGR